MTVAGSVTYGDFEFYLAHQDLKNVYVTARRPFFDPMISSATKKRMTAPSSGTAYNCGTSYFSSQTHVILSFQSVVGRSTARICYIDIWRTLVPYSKARKPIRNPLSVDRSHK